uniref:Vesicle transport protein GOT1A n=1 Tax=Triticum urartu TaxID=4572 RepID=A0A8R7QTB5_TRIUA
MAYEISEIKKIGIGLVGFGILFSFLGVILFFDRGLLALGNIFFLTGVGLLLGWQSMWQLFTKKANIKGSVPFFLGLFLLFVRWPVAGIILELGYGAPIQAFLYQIPIIGWILQCPFQLFGLRRKRA